MRSYLIEITDTFGGDANYSWVRRVHVKANTTRGAINKLSKHYGAGWRKDYDTGDTARYNLNNAAICCFVMLFGDYESKHYSNITTI